MPNFYDGIPQDLIEWCLKQSIFWTGSAPRVGQHINVSPKGMMGCAFTFLGPNSAAYVDLSGSGAETVAHVYENGRITIMFNSFDTSPRILRLFCKGTVLEADQPGFVEMLEKVGGTGLTAPRAIILLDIFKVQTTCGYGVPVLSLTPVAAEGAEKKPCFEDRTTLQEWASKKVESGAMPEYWRLNNAYSLDGIPGLRAARRSNGERFQLVGDIRAWGRRVVGSPDSLLTGMVIGITLGVLSGGFVPKVFSRAAAAVRIWIE